MPADASPITAAATALKAKHGDLLAGEPSHRQTPAQRLAVAAVEVAQARLRGDERRAADQMALDLRGR